MLTGRGGAQLRLATCGLLFFLLLPAVRADTQLLEPEQAFRFAARLVSPRLIEVRYQVADGYYLYKSKLAFRSEPPGPWLGAAELPSGTWQEDEFFGRSEIYRVEVTIHIPLQDEPPRRFVLIAVSQGCADVGVCYLPTIQRATLFNLH
jgi:thiol:disulfide interchange protein DsbD